MNKKLVLKLLILLAMTAWSIPSFAAETMDIPQNTSIETQPDKNEIEKTSPDKDKTDKDTVSQQEEEQKETAQKEEKDEKSNKFFTRAKKDNKKQQETTAETEGTTDVIVDSETIEYFPERHEIEATGNAKVTFPSENSVLMADRITFNHDTNQVKGFGHVVLIKEGQKINGEYIQVDLNEDNALMTRPVLNHVAIKIRAKTGIVYDAQTEAIDGNVTFNDEARYKFCSRPIFGTQDPMIEEAINKEFYFKEKYDNKWKLKAKTIVIDSYKDRDIATLKNADIYIKNTKIGSAGKLRLYTDKEQQYIETNMLELGSMRNFGAYVSPGIVFQTPNASTLKIGPALTYKSQLGVGALGRFLTDKNRTEFGWSSSKSKFVVEGEQSFTDNLKLEYGINSYMSNGFLGGRMPEYGVQLVHSKGYNIEDLGVSFHNRFTGGFARDWDRSFSTTRFTWQTSTGKSLFTYKNTDQKFAVDFGVNAQTHAALYGNGDTMGVVRGGPYIKTQYRRWQQYLGYYIGGQAGETPFYFDQNFYGKSNIVVGESLRICKYLTLMYSGTIVVSNDTPDGNMLQENRFYAAIGPDDLKFLIGYDAYRQNATVGIMMDVGAENSDVEFKRLILNDPQAIGQHDKKERERAAAQRKRAQEKQEKATQKEDNVMDKSVKDYRDYNPGFNMMPGGTMLTPSFIRPPGM